MSLTIQQPNLKPIKEITNKRRIHPLINTTVLYSFNFLFVHCILIVVRMIDTNKLNKDNHIGKYQQRSNCCFARIDENDRHRFRLVTALLIDRNQSFVFWLVY